MKKSKVRLPSKSISLIFFLLSAPLVLALSGADFLKIKMGAQQVALGGMGAAIPAGSLGMQYNPALLGFNSGYAFGISHRQGFFDTYTDLLSGSMPLYKGNVGFGLLTEYIGQSDELNLQGEKVGTLQAYDGAMTLGYAMPVWRLMVGVSGKWIFRKVAQQSLSTYGFDLGINTDLFDLWSFFSKGKSLSSSKQSLLLGISVLNIGGQIDNTAIPLMQKTGIWYKRFLFKWLTFAVGSEATYWQDEKTLEFAVGGNLQVFRYLVLQGGYNIHPYFPHISVGGGIVYPIRKNFIVRLDYAYEPNILNEQNHIFDVQAYVPFSSFYESYVEKIQEPIIKTVEVKRPKYRVLVLGFENQTTNEQAYHTIKSLIDDYFANTFQDSKNVMWVKGDTVQDLIQILQIEDVYQKEARKKLAEYANANFVFRGIIREVKENKIQVSIYIENIKTEQALLQEKNTISNNIELLQTIDFYKKQVEQALHPEKNLKEELFNTENSKKEP